MPRRFPKRKTYRRKTYKARPKIPFSMALNTHVFRLRYDVQNMTSNVLGDIVQVYNVNNFSGSVEYGSLQNMFDMYKVIMCKVHYYPILTEQNATNNNTSALYCVNDYNDATAPTTTSEMIQYSNCKVRNLFRKWTHTVKLTTNASSTSTGNAGFHSFSAPPTIPSIKMFATALSTSTTYGQFVIEHIVCVKNRR